MEAIDINADSVEKTGGKRDWSIKP
jgi:hypothetical protein